MGKGTHKRPLKENHYSIDIHVKSRKQVWENIPTGMWSMCHLYGEVCMGDKSKRNNETSTHLVGELEHHKNHDQLHQTVSIVYQKLCGKIHLFPFTHFSNVSEVRQTLICDTSHTSQYAYMRHEIIPPLVKIMAFPLLDVMILLKIMMAYYWLDTW